MGRVEGKTALVTGASRGIGRAIAVELAREACRVAGVEHFSVPIRGGTDGSKLTEKGVPTPNIFTGGQNYHSTREWASVQDMAAAAATVVELVRVWAEPETQATG